MFDSSAIKLPDLGGVMTSLPGKFTSNTTPRDVSPAVTASKPIGQFRCLPPLRICGLHVDLNLGFVRKSAVNTVFTRQHDSLIL